MMSFIKQHRLKFTPLSPVHIGADETYEPGNYVIDEDSGALYGFDSQAAINGLDENDRKHLLSIVNDKPNDEMLTKVQSFFHGHRDKLIGYSHTPVPTAKGVASLYQKRIGQTAQHESKNRRVINKLEIERTFYNPANNQPLLPGSSIKGAIRTALLDKCNDNKRTLPKERNQGLQKRLLEGCFHTDPFRLISISDAHWQGDQALPTTQIQIAVNRKREPVMKEGKLIQSQAERKNLYQLLECIPAIGEQVFQGSMQIQNVSQLRQDDKKLPKQGYQWDIKQIAEACNAFYYDLFQKELQQLKDRNYIQTIWLKKIEQLLAQGLFKRMDNGEVFLLRVGRHSGAEGVTLNEARRGSIKINQGPGKTSTWEDKPKTWWLAADDIAYKTNMLPFGWVLVEIDPKDKPSEPQQNNAELADWYQTQQQKQTALREKAKQKQALIYAKQQQEKLAEQQAQAKELAEQQRIASLSPFDQELEAFLKAIQVQEHDTRLLQALIDGKWQDEEARKIAEIIKTLMQQSNKWMPEFSGTNKKKIKLKERSLKVQSYLDM